MTRRQWTGLFGIAFVVAYLASLFTSGTTPDSDGAGAAERYADFWNDNGNADRGFYGAMLVTYAAAALVCFATGLRTLLRGVDSAGARVVRTAGTASAALFIVGVALVNSSGIARADSSGFEADGRTAILLEEVGYVVMTGAVMMAAVMAVGFALGNRVRPLVPAWTAVFAGLLALAGIGSVFTAWIGFMALPLWAAITSILLLVTRGAQEPAAT